MKAHKLLKYLKVYIIREGMVRYSYQYIKKTDWMNECMSELNFISLYFQKDVDIRNKLQKCLEAFKTKVS